DRRAPARRIRPHPRTAPADAERGAGGGSRPQGPAEHPRRQHRREGGHALPDAAQGTLMSATATPAQVLDFWFVQTRPAQWWQADPAFDEQLRIRFGECLLQAARAELWAWRADARGRLAEIIVLDQFSRKDRKSTRLN